MPAIRIQEGASHRLDDIYRYTRGRWGDDQAETYITGLFAAFDKIVAHSVVRRQSAACGAFGYPALGVYCAGTGRDRRSRLGAARRLEERAALMWARLLAGLLARPWARRVAGFALAAGHKSIPSRPIAAIRRNTV